MGFVIPLYSGGIGANSPAWIALVRPGFEQLDRRIRTAPGCATRRPESPAFLHGGTPGHSAEDRWNGAISIPPWRP